jgi:hypothetical protein
MRLVILCLLAVGGRAEAAGLDFENHPVNQWVRQSPRPEQAAPPFGWEGSGCYDPWSRLWIHFGGHDGIPQGFPLFTFDLNTGAWAQRFPNISPPGVCCVDGAAAFDVAQHRFVRFPGAMLGHGYQWSRAEKLKNSSVWLYDPAANRWANMRPEPYRPYLASQGLGSLNASATYDPIHELALSFGGQSSSGGTNNLFAYDAYANRLHRFDAANPPSPRDGMGLAYDAKHDCLVMFGSQYASDEKTWIFRYATNKWEAHALEPHPLGKKGKTYSTIPRLAYDSLHEVCLCVTRDDEKGEHQTWALDVGKLRWERMSPAAEPVPSMSRSRNLDFSPEHNVFILETVPQPRGKTPEIWTYRYAKAPPATRPDRPADLRAVTSADAVTLTWTAAAAPVKEYHIYRARAEQPWTAKFEKVAAAPAARFEDRDPKAGELCRYHVRAVALDGAESAPSLQARNEPLAPEAPVVSVLGPDRVEVTWSKHPAEDVAGYNLYVGTALMRAVKKGVLSAWKDNDPEYAEPLPVEVRDITGLHKLNDKLLTSTSFADNVNLSKGQRDDGDYKHQVLAYVLKAVNRRGLESGPSPYVLTLPSAPSNVLCRERGTTAELKWDANPEKGIAGYHIYKLGKSHWEIVRVTDTPLTATTFTHESGRNTTRYWVVAVDALGQEGEPSSPAWFNQSYKGFFRGEWHQ